VRLLYAAIYDVSTPASERTWFTISRDLSAAISSINGTENFVRYDPCALNGDRLKPGVVTG
ncbi:26750_t:CDS:1, partial [Dentiscutata erythropus]